MYDIIIRNGKIVDGSGRAGFFGDLGIIDERITFVGKRDGAVGQREIDATGKTVCPGIVDIHSHADLTLYRDDHYKILEPLIRQGITTFIGGNCGMAMAPISEKHRQGIKDMLEAFTRIDFENVVQWRKMGEYFDFVEKQGLLLNAGILVPHGILRINAVGLEERFATEDELKEMERLLSESLEAGAIGLSTGLQYFPGSHSNTDELVKLGRVVRKFNGIYASHLRSYSSTLGMAIGEIIEIAQKAEIPAQISHIFWVPDLGFAGPFVRRVVRGAAWLSKYYTLPIPLDVVVSKQIVRLEKMKEKGIYVGMDVMPTTTGFTHLLAFFPPWVLTGNRETILDRLKSRKMRNKMLKSIEKGKTVWPHIEGDSWSLNLFKIMGWECARIMAVDTDKNKRYEGRSIISIAREMKKHPLDIACDLLIEENGKVLIFESMAEPDDNFTERSMFAPIKHPEVAVSTDTILMGFGKPSPLFHSCYPKFISRYVREKKMLPLETAIRKITSLPAKNAGVRDRGLLKENFYADILIFDFERIAPKGDFFDSEVFPDGIHYVIINGKIVLEEGNFNPFPLSGKLIRNS